MNNVVVYQSKQSRLARIKNYCENKYAQWGVGATVATMAVASHAEDSGLDVTPLTGAMTSAGSNAKLVFGGALIVLGLFVGWKYLKRGANSA